MHLRVDTLDTAQDVVVMDDPLSAMDAHVGAKVFQSCIMALRSSGKAVLMTTNQLQFCAAADEIIIMEQGKVAHRGTFEEVSWPHVCR